MKKEMVSELEDRAIETVLSDLQIGFFFLMNKISGTCGTISKGQTFVSWDSWREKRTIMVQEKNIRRNNGRQHPKFGETH